MYHTNCIYPSMAIWHAHAHGGAKITVAKARWWNGTVEGIWLKLEVLARL